MLCVRAVERMFGKISQKINDLVKTVLCEGRILITGLWSWRFLSTAKSYIDRTTRAIETHMGW